MKFKSFNRVLAALLMLTMLAGQVLMSTAMALNEEPGIVILDESDLLETEPTPTPAAEPPEGGELPAEGGMPTPGAAETIEISEEDLTATPTPMPVEPTDTPEASPTIEPIVTPLLTATLLRGFNLMSNNADELANGGITINISGGKETVEDGEICTFSVTIMDTDLNKVPNLVENTEVTVKLPEFLDIKDVENAYNKDWKQWFKNAEYDQNEHKLILTLANIDSSQQTVGISFNIETVANFIGYDGDGKGKISIGIAGLKESETEIGTGTGTGTGEKEPYLQKTMFANYMPGADKDKNIYILNDSDKPITYRINFGVSKNYTQRVAVVDNMSNGALALCDVSGSVDASLDKCIKLYIDGSRVALSQTGGSLTGTHNELGNITISKGGTGFSVIFSREEVVAPGNDEALANIELRYFAKLVGNVNDVTNKVEMEIDNNIIGTAQVVARKFKSGAVTTSKYIMNGSNEVTELDINEKTGTVTFRIRVSAYGEIAIDKDTVIVKDVLEDCFSYKDKSVKYGTKADEYFKLEVNGQTVTITKIKDGAIAQGFYTIDFTVDVNMNKLQPGDAAQNKISESNVVYIHRDAELTVNKTWEGDGAGEKATFRLIGPKGDIDTATVTGNGSATLYIGADKLNEDNNICTLHEIVAESSKYVAGPDKKVVINKKDNVVTIVSVEDENVNKGTASVSIKNTPDSGVGSVTFKKLGEGKEQIGDGTFQLWKENEGSDDELIKTFSTVNGSWTSSPIEYGTYYVKEIAAPQGYILDSKPSDGITIKKTAAHGTITMTNEKYTAGSITIKKVDENGNPLAGAEFTLLGPKTDKKTTDNNGVAEFTGLEAGKYSIIEKTAPKGYGRYDGTVTVEIKADGTATVDDLPKGISFAGETVTLTWTNTRDKGSISITKTDGNQPLSGAVFGLYENKDLADNDPKTAVTNGQGVAEFNDLSAGTYYLKEITAPNGYALDETIRPFKIGGNNDWDVETTIKNTLKEYSLTLVKKGDDGKPLEGVEFEISGNGITKKSASGRDGVVTFTGLAFGEYTITEVEAPQGYVKAAPIKVTIDGSDSAERVIQLEPIENKHTKLTVTKFAEDGKTALPGAEFIIRNAEGKYVKVDGTSFASFADKKEDATAIVTGENGTFTLEYLPLGKYVLEEIEAPEGYMIVTASKDFEIKNSETRVSINNTKIKTGLKIVKTDENGKLLEGIKFTLKNSADGFVTASGSGGKYTYTGRGDTGTEFTTDGRGEIFVSGLLWGTYYLSETNAPKGMVGIKDQIVKVDAENHNKTIELKLENRSEKGKIEFTKTDGAGNGLAGAVFKLKLVEGSGTAYSTVKQMYAISDDKGRVSFEDVPYGVYELSEVIAPEGYVRSNDTYYVSIGDAVAEGKKIDSVPNPWTNSRTEKEFTVKKVSADGGEPLSGAVFQVLDEGNNPIENKIITTNGGSGKIKLPLGKYYLKETAAPEGYELNEELIPFEVTTNGRNTVTVKNTPKTGSLTIQKADKDDKPLLGAEFKIYAAKDKARENPITLITDSSGKAIKTGIPYGSYVAIESRAPEGYERDDTEHTFDIPQKDEDGKVTEVEDVTISVTNVKSRYALRIVKVDKDNSEIRLAGARFAVSGGSFYIEAVTGEDGTVTVEVPEKGKYLITELEPPAGYTIDPKTYTVEVKAHSADDVNIAAIHKSQDHQTRVELTKVNEKGQQLEGAEFSILDAEGKRPAKFTQEGSVYTYSESGSVTEIEAGYAEIVGLPVGSYILRENEAPKNYIPMEDMSFHVRADLYDKALELTVENLPHEKGIAVLKESPDGTRLKGAVFTLYKADNTEVEKVTTDKAGVALFTGLKSGSYYIKETAAPEGYKPLDNRFEFTIDEKGNLKGDGFSGDGLYMLTVENSPLEYGFKVKKVSTNDEGLTLPGAEFRILGGGLDKRYTTGADGLTEQITLPIGEYTLTEMKAPESYVINGAGRHISVKADGIYLDGGKLGEGAAITVRNAPVNFKLRLVKVDADTNQPLANVAFMLKGEKGAHSLITGSNGITDTISLAPGKYTLSEVAAAEGYAIPLNGWGFTVTEGTVQQVTNTSEVTEWNFKGGLLTLTLKNSRIYGGLTIEKTDGKDGGALAGAEFTISGSDGTPLTFIKNNGRYEAATGEGASSTIATDANGTAHITGLKFGNYAVTETKAPEGYVLKGDRHSIAISRQQTEVTLRLKNDKAMYKVTAIKQDAGENGKLLVGAEFTLYSAEGAVVAKAVTGYDGTAVFEVPEGKYKLIETRAPAGYQLSGDFVREITVKAVQGAVGEFKYTFNNEKTSYSIEIHKHDSEDKQKKLAGAEFAVTDSRGFTKTVTTDASGKASITELPYDDYTIREIKAPKGYALSDKEYSVKKTELVHGSPVVIEAANKYILGSVTIKKVDHENPEKLLEGAKFNVTDENGSLLKWKAEGDVYTLDERGSNVITAGRVTLKDLPEGTYTLTEIDAPSGYAILDGSRTFTITEANMTAPLEIKVENLLRRTAVGFIKVDKNNKELRLAGAEFTLYRMNGEKQGEVVATGVTNNNGLVTFTELTMGSYRAKETKAPKGYKLWNAPIDFTVDEYGKVSVGSTELKPEGLVYTAMITNTAEEKEITLKKVSDTGEALTGATFRLSGEKSYILTTGSDGTAKISLPYGDYILEEVIAPDGYVLSSEKQALNLSDSGLKLNGKAVSGFTVTLKNQPVTFALTLHKRDASYGQGAIRCDVQNNRQQLHKDRYRGCVRQYRDHKAQAGDLRHNRNGNAQRIYKAFGRMDAHCGA